MLNLRSFQVIRFIERCLHGRQDDSPTYTITSHWGMPSRKNRQFAPEDRKFPPKNRFLSSNHWFSGEVCYFQVSGIFLGWHQPTDHWFLTWKTRANALGWHSMFSQSRVIEVLQALTPSIQAFPPQRIPVKLLDGTFIGLCIDRDLIFSIVEHGARCNGGKGPMGFCWGTPWKIDCWNVKITC